MPGVTDKLSAVAFQIHTFRDDMSLGTATAFLCRAASMSLYLVTNYHVLSGYNPDTGQPLHPMGALPNRMTFHMPTRIEAGPNAPAFNYIATEKSLLASDSTPLWKTHPRLGNAADVVALDLGYQEGVQAWTINDASRDSSLFDDFTLRPGLDVFAIGFPLGISVAEHLAIWKRGTIASEPLFDVNGKPIILIDSATRAGMSGSPVIAQIQGLWGGRYLDGGHMSPDTRMGTGRKFIGMYSGRLGNDEFLAQLGVVWKLRVIEETVEQGELLDVKTATEAPPAQIATVQ